MKTIRFRFVLLMAAALVGSTLGFGDLDKIAPPFLHGGQKWVDSVFNTLTPRERMAQLIQVAAYSNREKGFEDSLSQLIKTHKIGGLIFFQGGPGRQARLTNRYQSESSLPLLISIDAEWGLGMRLDSTISFPYQMTLGAIQNDSLIYQMGGEIARQCQRMGIHMNFAPVADVNNNPKNPVISYRSFGENTKAVISKSRAYMQGMQDHGILTSAKHFPGHGDTETDSHYDLPKLPHDLQRLEQVEFAPFQKLIDAGVAGVMVAHMNIPALDSTENLPSTLSKPIVTDLLQKKMGFKGLIMTDALNMQGVTKFYKPGEVDVKALIAGNDMLLFTQDVEKALDEIENAVRQRKISQREIDIKCRKVLAAKYWAGLSDYRPIKLEGLIEDLNSSNADLLQRQLLEASLTVVKNESAIPITNLETLSIASVSVGADHITPFQQMLEKYTRVDHFLVPKGATSPQTGHLDNLADRYDLVVIGLHQVGRRPRNTAGYTQATYDLLQNLTASNKAVVVNFRNPYTLEYIPNAQNIQALVSASQDQAQEFAAQLLFGAIEAKGKLPVSVNGTFTYGLGLTTAGGARLKYTIPEELGINSQYLHRRVDSVVQVGLDSLAYPGAQVLVAKDGKVFLHKVYGYHTYEQQRPVREDDIYDLASVTKITGPLPALMRLHAEGKIDLDVPFSNYWEDFKGTDKDEMTVREVLSHYAQLQAWIAYWEDTKRKNGNFKSRYFRSDSSRKFPIRVAHNLYLRHDYRQKEIYKAIRKSPLGEEKEYLYSGLSFYLYPQIIENLTGRSYEEFLKKEFYHRLGAYTLTYNPLRYYSQERIVPTENDDFFRMQQLQGTVHDEGAAMMEGVSGNAGLFSTANDLAKIMQMYLQEGSYGEHSFISPASVREFSSCQYCDQGNRRGLGFDKPVLENKMDGSTAWDASDKSFGHSGYTGTFTWVDPENGLLFVFMSNRVYPTRENRKLYQLSIRPGIHQVLYDALRQGLDAS